MTSASDGDAPKTNRRWILERRPDGPVDDTCFRLVHDAPPGPLADGEILLEVLYLSIDPAQRTWIARDSYMPAIAVGDVVRSLGVGRVVQSRQSGYGPGDIVSRCPAGRGSPWSRPRATLS